jgi:hypothetical protein
MVSYRGDSIGAADFSQECVLRTFEALPLAITLVALSALPARAEAFFTPFWGHNFGGDTPKCESLTNCEETHANLGVSFGSMGKVIGYEQDIARSKDFFGKVPGKESSVITLMSNVLVGVGVGPVQPYGLFGFGLIRPKTTLIMASPIGDFTLDESKNSLGFDLGGGVNGYFSKRIGIRGDIRRFQTIQEVPLPSLTSQVFSNERLSFWRFSIGMALR